MSVLYVATFLRCSVLTYDPVRDECIVVGRGRLVFMTRTVPIQTASTSTLIDAKLIAMRQTVLFPEPQPFRWSGGLLIIPLLPLLGASMALAIPLLGWYSRWRWWQHLIPAVPFAFCAVAMNGRWMAVVGNRGFAGGLSVVGAVLWFTGVAGAIVTTALWMAYLPRNAKRYRESRRRPEGDCQCCGYDLTGNESGICPECGCGTNLKRGG